MSESKEEYVEALGLRKLTEQEKAIGISKDRTWDENQTKNSQKLPDRIYRRTRLGNGIRPPLSTFFSDWKLAKKPRVARKFSSKSTTKKPDEKVNTSTVLTKSPPLQQQGQNVLLLPKQCSPQKTVQIQPNIVLGQTIFQAPDGKKFILIPQSAAKPNAQGLVTVTKPHSQSQTTILPLTSNANVQSSTDSTAPQRFFYLPQSHSVLGTTNVRSTGVPRTVTIGNAAATSVITSVSAQQKLEIDGKSQHEISTVTTARSSISPNIIHLLNMTKNVLNESSSCAVSVNPAVSQNSDISNILIPSGPLIPSGSVSLVPGSHLVQKSSVNSAPTSSMSLAVSSNLSAWGLTQSQTNQTLQVLKVKRSEPIQSAVNTIFSAQSPIKSGLLTNAVLGSNNANSENNSPVLSLAVVPKVVSSQKAVDVSMIGANTSEIGIIGIVGSKMTVGTTFHPLSTATISHEMKPVVSMYPVVTTQRVPESPLKALESRTVSVKDLQGEAPSTKRTLEESMESSIDETNRDMKQTAYYSVDPDRHLRNAETNCVVILGKKRRKAHGVKGSSTALHRRYGGPPFMPCKAPPSPHTPSSSTCCLYEHTLLKMATRGFWGCEMGKLQDVFRSIRCESVDQDTVEDVTKRCYGFVKTKLLQAGEDSKAMYRYMKNYIDEFDSFLDRVYPVAIIAMLIYLPTAADYSLVTWHGIPPTGWSEYRRAVVMREVFEVIYRFWNELGTVPDYKKEFFDCPAQSSLLVPRVFDLRQSYSDPTTCVVQKVSQGDRRSADYREAVRTSNVYIKHQRLSGVKQKTENDCVSGRINPAQELNCNLVGKCKLSLKDEPVDKSDLDSREEDLPVSKEDKSVIASIGDRCSSVDDLLMTVRPRSSHSSYIDFLCPGSVDAASRFDSTSYESRFDSTSYESRFDSTSYESRFDSLCSPEAKREVPMTTGVNNTGGTGISLGLFGRTKVEGLPGNGKSGQAFTESDRSNTISTHSDSDDNGARKHSDKTDGTVNSSVVDRSESSVQQSRERKVISARFAESIAAACGNNLTWSEHSGDQEHCHVYSHGTNDDTESLCSTPTTKNSGNMSAPLEIGSVEGSTRAVRIAIPAQSKNETSTMSYSRQSSASETNGECSTLESLRDSESVMQRRRTPRRHASSARFDLLIANDDMSLERDLRRAIKLSKLETTASSKANEVGEDINLDVNVSELSKSERVPLKTSLKRFRAESGMEQNGDIVESPIDKLKKLKRSVAFEALWRQKSVEEPVVIQDEKVYSLGEYLENFPIETHCPLDRTIIRIYSEDYNAREILGYLRRGTQLVEQVGDDVVIDTTRTVKSNSTILAVRKVPPGKISKLVHPGLHLENYTNHLLPFGIKQPLKGRKGFGKSTKVKRKSSVSKEDVAIKSEPQSPVNNSAMSVSVFENPDGVSPPPQKTAKLDDCGIEGSPVKSPTHVTVEVQTTNERACKETQTLDYNDNVSTGHAVVSDITDVDSLEQALSTILENALASLAESSIANNDKCNTAFDDIIKSYERAGNFLLSTAKMLSRLKLKKSL